MPTFKTAFRWVAVVTPFTLVVMAIFNRIQFTKKLING